MEDLYLLGGFFLFMMALVAGVGYWYLRRLPAEESSTAVLLTDTLHAVGSTVPLPVKQERAQRIEKMLVAAGYRSLDAISIFNGIKMASMALLGVLLPLLSVAYGQSGLPLVLSAIAGVGLGYLLPERILQRRVQRRAMWLKHSLPMALELMVLSLEAGQSLDAAMIESAYSLRQSHPEIAEEFLLVQKELRANSSRQDALRNMMQRNLEPEIKRFAQVLLDADRFGTSLGQALRNQLKYLRTHLRQEAQESARKVGVKLVFPVFFLLFPAVLVVALGPALLMLKDQLANQLDGILK